MLGPGLVLTNLDKRFLTCILYSYHILTLQDRKRDSKQSDKDGAFMMTKMPYIFMVASSTKVFKM